MVGLELIDSEQEELARKSDDLLGGHWPDGIKLQAECLVNSKTYTAGFFTGGVALAEGTRSRAGVAAGGPAGRTIFTADFFKFTLAGVAAG
jgi:hypothetical protein